MNIMAFRVLAVPDPESGRRLYGDPKAMAKTDDDDVIKIMILQRAQETLGTSEIVRPMLRRAVAIGACLVSGESCERRLYSGQASSEQELMTHFFDDCQQFSPNLVSWQGAHFDLPVLRYRAMLHGLSLPSLWREPKVNWHTDIAEALSGQAGAEDSLHDFARLIGVDGPPPLNDDETSDAWLAGDWASLEALAQGDALRTCQVYLRWQWLQGQLEQAHYERIYAALNAG